MLIILFLLNTNGICDDTTEQIQLSVETFKAEQPEITLFESIEVVKQYVKKNLNIESSTVLQSVNLVFIANHPKKGICWQYHWSEMGVIGGGDFSIFHYMDGEIIYYPHGP